MPKLVRSDVIRLATGIFVLFFGRTTSVGVAPYVCDDICAFLIDTKHLISTWSQGNCEDDISKLISEIEKVIKGSH